jgi:hypothetical protein
MTGAQTYVETEALLAVMDGDYEKCDEILAGFLPGELIRFHDQAAMLADRCRRERYRRRAALPEGGTDG